MEKNFKDLIQDIRPYIVKGIQDAKVNEYEQSYRRQNGKKPSAEEINQFISILIANGTVKSDADEIVNELIDKYSKKLLTKLIINSSISLGSAGLFLVYILIYLNNVLGLSIVKEDYLISAPNFILAVILFFIAITLFVISISKKDKN
jgi:hypothetical protein